MVRGDRRVGGWGAVTLALLGIAVPLTFDSTALGIVLLTCAVVTAGLTLRAWAAQDPEPSDESRKADSPPREPRRGYVGRKGSTGDLSHASFSDKLDTGIDNEGNVDASQARFGVADEADSNEPGAT